MSKLPEATRLEFSQAQSNRFLSAWCVCVLGQGELEDWDVDKTSLRFADTLGQLPGARQVQWLERKQAHSRASTIEEKDPELSVGSGLLTRRTVPASLRRASVP